MRMLAVLLGTLAPTPIGATQAAIEGQAADPDAPSGQEIVVTGGGCINDRSQKGRISQLGLHVTV